MGRRSLPKINTSIDLSDHLVRLDPLRIAAVELQLPFDPQFLFPDRQPLEIEVGCGKGLFLVNESARRPDSNFLGCEVSPKYARFTAYRLAKAKLANARVVLGDAGVLFGILPTDSAHAVHVYFPDPWWKARHRRRRIMNPDFVAQIVRVLQIGGEVHFWSDVQEYFETAVSLLAANPVLDGPHVTPVKPAEHDMDYQTHFERRMRLGDHDVFRCRFVKSRGLTDEL
jgi:tRNA (guanine-N7-)-methyltransferase